MKIYTEQPAIPKPTGNPDLDNLIQKYIDKNMELIKYKLMWSLRSIEKEYNESGGHIVIKKDGDLEFNGFPAEMESLIRQTLSDN
jgi:hypothetical protein